MMRKNTFVGRAPSIRAASYTSGGMQASQQGQEGEWRRLPDVDEDQRNHRQVRVEQPFDGRQVARTVDAVVARMAERLANPDRLCQVTRIDVKPVIRETTWRTATRR